MGHPSKSQSANWNWRGGRGQTSGLSQEARASLHQASRHDGLGGREVGLLASGSKALKRKREMRVMQGHFLSHNQDRR